MPRTFDKDPVVCGVCLRQATGLGYAPAQGKPILWLCERLECISLGKTAFHMKHAQFNSYEQQSLADAGDAAGAYLESIGKFNLAELSEDEWKQFLTHVLSTYGAKMRERILNNQAPF